MLRNVSDVYHSKPLLALTREMVLCHDSAPAGLLGEVVDLGEASRLGVKAREAEALVPRHAVFALCWAADCHAETLGAMSASFLIPPYLSYLFLSTSKMDTRTGGNAVIFLFPLELKSCCV